MESVFTGLETEGGGRREEGAGNEVNISWRGHQRHGGGGHGLGAGRLGQDHTGGDMILGNDHERRGTRQPMHPYPAHEEVMRAPDLAGELVVPSGLVQSAPLGDTCHGVHARSRVSRGSRPTVPISDVFCERRRNKYKYGSCPPAPPWHEAPPRGAQRQCQGSIKARRWRSAVMPTSAGIPPQR